MKETNCNNPTCGKKLKHTEGRRPKKYCSPACRNAHYKIIYPPKQKVKGMVKLPDDFIGFDKIAIVSADGTITELKTPDQLPKHLQMNMETVKELEQPVNFESKTNSGLVTPFKQYDYSAMPKGMMYAAQQKWKKQARIEQDKTN